jgi:hypothetical protein
MNEKSKLDSIVKSMIEQHIGGEVFFNHLDKKIQQKSIIKQIITLIYSHDTFDNMIIASGKFGLFLSNYFQINYPDKLSKLILVEGGLRKGATINLDYMNSSIQNRDFIFIDDSFYLGRTRNVIKKEIEKLGGNLIATYVAYDGSKIKESNVHSLYRYYK